MILKYNEFVNEKLNIHKQLNEISQDDDLSTYYWNAGSVNDKDFDEVFKIEKISDSTLNRMIGNSYPEDCEISISDLRYLIIPHYDGKGAIRIGELVCNKEVSDEFIYLFKELFKNKYPIERMVLIDDYNGDDKISMEANNTSAFNYRVISDTDKLSRHAYGMAIDINPLYNPYVKGDYISPKSSEQFVNRDKSFKYMLEHGDLIYKILHDKFGFTWGGDWEKCKDYQHYEK